MAEPLIIQDQKKKQEEIHVSQNAVEQKNVNAQTNVVGQVQGRQSLNSVRESLAGNFKEADLEKLDVKKKEKIVPAGPQYIGLDKKFGFKMKGDSDRMLAIRDAVFNYNTYKGTTGFDEEKALGKIVKACNAYTKGRFMLLKAGRVAGKRMSEVKQLRDQCKQQLRKSMEDRGAKQQEINVIFNDTRKAYLQEYSLGTFSMIEAVIEAFLRLTIENLAIRLPLTLLMLPFWAVNKLVAKIRKAATGKETTQLKLPGMHRMKGIDGYYMRIVRRKKKYKTHRSFFDTWFKSPATKDRADADFKMALNFDEDEQTEDDKFDAAH